MRIKILPSALDDLRCGWDFYERQQIGLGDYFQDSLFSDVDSQASLIAQISDAMVRNALVLRWSLPGDGNLRNLF